VNMGGEPAWVPDCMVQAIRARVAEVSEAGGSLVHRFSEGDCVVIREGVFAGYEAIFDACLSGCERARVLLEMLNDRRVRLEVDAHWIERCRN